MVANTQIRVGLLCILFIQASGYAVSELTQDQTTSRVNTLYDDADDIQKQLDNEARDRMRNGYPKTVWVLNFPTTLPDFNWFHESSRSRRNSVSKQYNVCLLTERATDNTNSVMPLANLKLWDYFDQNNWSRLYPECGGRSQSPVNLPAAGIVKAKGARKLLFCNYNVPAVSMNLEYDGQTVTLYGKWNKLDRPLVYGGAAHCRRYLFHSLTLHWPSEHMIGGLQYPIESQALHVAAEYPTYEDAIAASPKDKLAFLGIVNIYKFTNHSHDGLKSILQVATGMGAGNHSLKPRSLGFFNPPFQKYVTYQGSLTTPPCTEAVLWFVRGRSLPVERHLAAAAQKLTNPLNEPMKLLFRQVQPMNDRKTYFFG